MAVVIVHLVPLQPHRKIKNNCIILWGTELTLDVWRVKYWVLTAVIEKSTWLSGCFHPGTLLCLFDPEDGGQRAERPFIRIHNTLVRTSLLGHLCIAGRLHAYMPRVGFGPTVLLLQTERMLWPIQSDI
jgi:hypothetical protein